MRKGAFTLVELVFIIVIMGILASIAVGKFGAAKLGGEVARANAALEQAIVGAQSKLALSEEFYAHGARTSDICAALGASGCASTDASGAALVVPEMQFFVAGSGAARSEGECATLFISRRAYDPAGRLCITWRLSSAWSQSAQDGCEQLANMSGGAFAKRLAHRALAPYDHLYARPGGRYEASYFYDPDEDKFYAASGGECDLSGGFASNIDDAAKMSALAELVAATEEFTTAREDFAAKSLKYAEASKVKATLDKTRGAARQPLLENLANILGEDISGKKDKVAADYLGKKLNKLKDERQRASEAHQAATKRKNSAVAAAEGTLSGASTLGELIATGPGTSAAGFAALQKIITSDEELSPERAAMKFSIQRCLAEMAKTAGGASGAGAGAGDAGGGGAGDLLGGEECGQALVNMQTGAEDDSGKLQRFDAQMAKHLLGLLYAAMQDEKPEE